MVTEYYFEAMVISLDFLYRYLSEPKMKTQSVFEKLNLKLICAALCFGLSGMCRGSCPFPLRLHEGLLRNRSR